MATTDTTISFYGYKNLFHQSGCSVISYEDKYTILIKSKAYPRHLKDRDAELAYDHCSKTFFDMVDILASIYGYKGYAVVGKNGGYLQPLIDGFNGPKPIDAVYTEYVSFVDLMIQEKVEAFGSSVIFIKENIENIYIHSSSLDEVIDLLEKIFEGVTYD